MATASRERQILDDNDFRLAHRLSDTVDGTQVTPPSYTEIRTLPGPPC